MCHACDIIAAESGIDSIAIHQAVFKSADTNPLTMSGLYRWEKRLNKYFLVNADPVLVKARDEFLEKVDRMLGRDTPIEAVEIEIYKEIPKSLGGLGESVISSTQKAERIVRDISMEVKKAREKQLAIESGYTDADTAAISSLIEYNNFWIREHFGDNITAEVKEIIAREFTKGHERKKIVDALLDRFQNVFGGKNYWETVAASWSVQTRTLTSLRIMDEAGIDEYIFRNPNDKKTSYICKELIGRVWKVKHALDNFNQMMEMDNAEDIKNHSPWISSDKNGLMYFKKDGEYNFINEMTTAELGELNILWPPRHGRCRSSIDAVIAN